MSEEGNKSKELVYNLRRLRHIRRCNTFPTITNEDVAAHSYYVAMLSLIVAREYNEWRLNIDNNLFVHENRLEYVSPEEVMLKALCHDISEVFTGDIPANFKHFDDAIHTEIIDKEIKILDDKLGLYPPFNYLETYAIECKDGFSGELVAIMDLIELSIYCAEEVVGGNKMILKLLKKSLSLASDMEHFNIFKMASPSLKSLYDSLTNISNGIYDDMIDLIDID